MSPATRGARLPGEAPQPFCERCGRSVEVARIGPRVGLCHCPTCDLFACRSCWSEAAEACPECGTRFGETPAARTLAADALAAGLLTANGLAAEALAANAQAPVARAPAAREEVPAPAAIDGEPRAVRRWKTQRVPAGIGVAVLAVAAFALILGNPFRAGGVEGALGPTNSPGGPARAGASAEPGAASPDGGGSPTVAPSTGPAATATDTNAQPAGGAAQTPRPTATATARPVATATPRPPDPTPTPRATAAPTPPPTPSPTATPTPEPPCSTVPNLVGLTVAKARAAWSGAGFTGAFTAPPGPAGKLIVGTQSRPAGACLPPSTSIAVTT